MVKDVENPPSVILVDLNMPTMNGFRFLDELSKHHQFNAPKVKIFILSGTADEREFKAALMHPMCTAFIHTPLSTGKMLAAMKEESFNS